MWSHQSFGRTISAIGIALFALALILNIRAAPDPPGFDVGPIAALWLIVVYIQMVRTSL
jgi:hypothetical protein